MNNIIDLSVVPELDYPQNVDFLVDCLRRLEDAFGVQILRLGYSILDCDHAISCLRSMEFSKKKE